MWRYRGSKGIIPDLEELMIYGGEGLWTFSEISEQWVKCYNGNMFYEPWQWRGKAFLERSGMVLQRKCLSEVSSLGAEEMGIYVGCTPKEPSSKQSSIGQGKHPCKLYHRGCPTWGKRPELFFPLINSSFALGVVSMWSHPGHFWGRWLLKAKGDGSYEGLALAASTCSHWQMGTSMLCMEMEVTHCTS